MATTRSRKGSTMLEEIWARNRCFVKEMVHLCDGQEARSTSGCATRFHPKLTKLFLRGSKPTTERLSPWGSGDAYFFPGAGPSRLGMGLPSAGSINQRRVF